MKTISKTQNPPDAPSRAAGSSAPRESWRDDLADAFTNAAALADFLDVSMRHFNVSPTMPVRVPRTFAMRMRPGDPADPLLLQVMPTRSEAEPHPGFCADPVGDEDAEVIPGLLQKYCARALVFFGSACAVQCRFCFRQHVLGEREGPVDNVRLIESLRQLRDVDEVILSGGDPLMRGDGALRLFIEALRPVAHIRRVRLHTRLPTVIPARVQTSLLDVLGGARQQVILVTHVNHPNELNDETAAALGRLRDAGVLLLNQSVLLRGVNDNADTLARLSVKLVAQGVLPYYLHQLDRARGTQRFEVSPAFGRRLIESMRARCPGYMVPRYVREIAGAPSKTPL